MYNKLIEKFTMWVARDNDGTLWFYTEKPERRRYAFVPSIQDYYHDAFDNELFDYITWENSPQLIEFTATPVNLCK